MTTHAKVSIYDLVEAVRDEMAEITSAVAKSNETVTEGVHDNKTLLINWSEWEGAPNDSMTHMNTFGKGLQLRHYTIEITLLASTRSQIGEGLADVANYANDIINKLEEQPALTPFGLSGVHTFHPKARQGLIEYGGVHYAGAIFTLEFLCH